MPCDHRLFHAVLIIQDDAVSLFLQCHGFREGLIDKDQFIAGVEEIAGKLLPRFRETLDGEKEVHFPSVNEIDVPF